MSKSVPSKSKCDGIQQQMSASLVNLSESAAIIGHSKMIMYLRNQQIEMLYPL
jgi:hypothetical protein